MLLLATNSTSILRAFPNIPPHAILNASNPALIKNFEHNAFSNNTQSFECPHPFLNDIIGKTFSLGIIEDYAPSSQFDRLRNGFPPQFAVFSLAFDGNGFHGQYNRKWHTNPGNLYLCMAIPVDLPISDAEKLQQLPATMIKHEITSLIRGLSGVIVDIKLPNDVIIRFESGPNAGQCFKIAGTLTEMRVSHERITQVRYGIGLNIMNAPDITEPQHLQAIALNDLISFKGFNDNLLSYFLMKILKEMSSKSLLSSSSFDMLFLEC